MFKPTIATLSSRELQRIDNRIAQRSVIGWTSAGSAYKKGVRYPGWLKLYLSGGGWLYYEENTPIDVAIADADDRGFSTEDARAKLDRWVRTGEGVTFTLSE